MTTDCHGHVLDYDEQRGYGRIRDEQNQEYFVHFRELIDTPSLAPGQAVQFKPVLHRKGNLAHAVRRL